VITLGHGCEEMPLESTRQFTAASMDLGSDDEDARARERALVEAAKRDPAAFAALYQLYFARVYRYLRMRLPREEDAADLTQQVFLRALDALPRYQPRAAPFAAWLFAIARHALADRFRRRHATLSLEVAAGLAADQGPEDAAIQRETHERLRELLGTLDPTARDLLALRFAAGLSAPEIAAVVGKRPDAVRKQLSRLLQGLKERYHVSP